MNTDIVIAIVIAIVIVLVLIIWFYVQNRDKKLTFLTENYVPIDDWEKTNWNNGFVLPSDDGKDDIKRAHEEEYKWGT